MESKSGLISIPLVFAALAALSFAGQCHAANSDPPKVQPSPGKGRIIVKYKKNGAQAVSLNRLRARHKIKKSERAFKDLDKKIRKGKSETEALNEIKKKFPARSRRIAKNIPPPEVSDIYLLELDSGTDPSAAVNDFGKDPNVEYAEREGVSTIQLVPNDPYYSSTGSWGQSYADLWGLKKVQAGTAWDLATGSGVIVAVVDTGIDYNHPDISANVWRNPGEIAGNGIDDDGNGFIDDTVGYDFANTDNNPMDGHGHGTHIAGTIAATGNNSLGVIGLAFNSKVMALKGLDDSGSGSDYDLAMGITYAADNGADVVNASWGSGGFPSKFMDDTINYAVSLGVVFVAAAGNSNTDASNFYPAAYTNSIAVAASDSNDSKAWFSNYGARIDVAAPGVDILSLQRGGSGYTRLSGTSMAAPHVCGLAALIMSQHPEYSSPQVRQTISNYADDIGAAGKDASFGYGRINAQRALAVSNDTSPPTIANQSSTVISSYSASVQWTTNENSTSQLEYGLSSAYGSLSALDGSLAKSHSQTLSGLAADTVYHFRVLSKDAAGNEAASGDMTFTTLPKTPDTVKPVIAVTSPSDNASVSGIFTLSGTASDNEALSKVEIAIDGGAASAASGTSDWSYSINSLALTNGAHSLSASAEDSSGNRSSVSVQIVVGNDLTAPSNTNVTASDIGTNSATLQWLTDEDSESQVEYGPAASYGKLSALEDAYKKSHAQILSGLSAGTLYHYRILSKDAAGNQTPSSDYTFTTSQAAEETLALRDAFTYPNPSLGDPKIRLQFGLADSVELRIFNAAGEEVLAETLSQANFINSQFVYEYQARNLANGIYIYSATAKKGGQTVRTKGKFAVVK